MHTSIDSIRKRSGEIVPFVPEKIMNAIRKAFTAVRGKADEELLQVLMEEVVRVLEVIAKSGTPTVEQVQNVVEMELMKRQLFDVAKDYIIYRFEHTKIREEKKKEAQEKIEKEGLFVTKRSGVTERFSMDKLRSSLVRETYGYEDVIDADAVLNQCRSELYEGISTKDIDRTLILTTRSLIEQDPAYAKVAARLTLKQIYKKVIGPDAIDFTKLEQQYREAFIFNIKRGVNMGRLDPRMLTFDLDQMAQYITPSRDDNFMYLGIQTLVDRYFVENPETRDILETPQAFWMRVAMGLALNEKEQKNDFAKKFYDVMSNFLYIPSTPTLFHSGTVHPQLSSCYLTTVMDSLDHIFKCYGDNAQLSKWSGGIGNDWTNLRGTGSLIKGTGVESQGVIPFLKIANDTTVAINRSGKRRGATCAYLETWHYDIEEFLELRKNTGDERRRAHDMDTANWIPDLFMKRIKEDGDWTLFSTEETPDLHHIYGRAFEERYAEYERRAKEGKVRLFKTMKARELWKKMITMLFETGHPWITFKDPCNVRSPQDHVGVIHSSNLCTEITLNTSEDETAVCNLGSINLARHMNGNQLNADLVKRTIEVAMRMLDNVIDLCFYPTKEAKHSNMIHRPVGLGIMGLQEALYAQELAFDDEASVEFADASMELITYCAYSASAELAKERGAYKSFKGSKWDRGIMPYETINILEKERGLTIDVPRSTRLNWNDLKQKIKQYGIRNSNCVAIAPTATISNVVDCTPGIEPIYKNLYVKSNQSGDFTIINENLINDLKKEKLWDYEMLGQLKQHDGSIAMIAGIPERLKAKYKEVFEIDPRVLIRMAAYRGRFIDQSQSLNIFYSGTSGKELNDIYLYAWEMGLKTTYYLRGLAASQVEKSTVSSSNVSIKVKTMEKKVEQQTAQQVLGQVMIKNTFSIQPMGKVQMSGSPEGIKLCKINDPTCESCQ